MSGRVLSILIVVFISIARNADAQNGYISMQDGLSNRFVTCILQDHNGLIWAGTGNGLNVYDGYTFKSYYTYSRDLKLSSSRINCMIEDAAGNLWIGTAKGLNRINAARTSNTIVPELAGKHICSLTVKDDIVFLGTTDGFIYQTDTAGTTKLLYNEHRDVAINGITKDDAGNTWFFTNSERKLFRLTPGYERDPNFHFNETVPSNFILKGDQLITASHQQNGLAIFNATDGSHIKTPFLDSLNKQYNKPVFIYPSRDNTLWVACVNGVLIRIDLVKKTVDEFSQQFRRGYFGSVINTCTEDNNGLLWAGTDGGIVKVSSSSHAFKAYYRNPDQGRPDEFVSTRGMIEDPQGNIYIGSYKGLLQLTHSGKTTAPVTDFSFNPPTGDKSQTVIPFAMLWEDNKILLTSMLHGLFYYIPSTKKFERAATPSPGRVDLELYGLLKDSKGATWVGTNKGMRLFDRATKKLVMPPGWSENDILKMGLVWTIVEHPETVLWAGTNKGLFRVNTSNGSITHYHLNSVPSLSNEEILCMAPDDDAIWLGSRGGGLMKLDTRTDSISYFNTSEGLTSDIVYGIVRDEKYLWLSTESGISRFNIATRQTKGYYEKDGINNNEFNTAAYLKASDGRIYFGGIDGITAFYPEELEEKSFEGKIILTSLKRGNEELLPSAAQSGLFHVDLAYDNRNLTIQAALTDYYNPGSNRFYYKINGKDDHWISLGNQHALHISQLEAGDYEIEMYAKNMNDRQSINTLTIRVHVAQVFYKQAWFITAMCVVILMVIYLFFRQREKELLRVQKLRTKIASDLHDDVGSMLTRVSILTEVLKRKNNSGSYRGQQEIEQIAQASRQATSTMSDILWSVDARNDKAENLVDRMREHADTLLQPLHINVHFNSHTSHHRIIDMQTRQGALLIFKEAVNNIAKHSNATDVTIQVRVEKNEFAMSISDNGTEISAKSGTGQGIKNMHMRAREMEAELVVQNGSGYHVSLVKKLS
ncbi:MAG: hypothetical protein KIT62_01825 [Cyclobacteriaceae bacterium]|nr:hypothetical protein [Cyclobacteriaceae bacterium]